MHRLDKLKVPKKGDKIISVKGFDFKKRNKNKLIQINVIGLSVLFGVLVWVIDSVLDYVIYYKGTNFFKLLVFEVPEHEIYIRSTIFACFIIFGIISSKILGKKKLAENELSESEQKYKELFNNMGNGVAVYEAGNDGQDFVIKDINKAGQHIMKISNENVIEKSVLEVFPWIKERGIFSVFQKVYRTGKPERHPISLS